MTWAKVDDQLHSHEKSERAGLEAMGLWTLALSHAAARLTNGFVSKERIKRFAQNAKKGDRLAESLRSVRLWHRADEPCPLGHEDCDRYRSPEDGYRFHDWQDYQPTREQVEAARTRKKRSLEEHRARKQAEKAEQTPDETENDASVKSISGQLRIAVGNRSEILSPDPDPVPIPSRPVPTRPDEMPSETPTPRSLPATLVGGPALLKSAVVGDLERDLPPTPPPTPVLPTIAAKVFEELGRSLKTRKLATHEWADELVLLAGAVRADDLCAAIRKCVVGAPEGFSEAALKQRIVGFVANARNIEAVRRTRAEQAEEPPKKAHTPGYIPLGPRPDIPPPPMLITGDPNEPIKDSPFPFLNAMGGKA